MSNKVKPIKKHTISDGYAEWFVPSYMDFESDLLSNTDWEEDGFDEDFNEHSYTNKKTGATLGLQEVPDYDYPGQTAANVRVYYDGIKDPKKLKVSKIGNK